MTIKNLRVSYLHTVLLSGRETAILCIPKSLYVTYLETAKTSPTGQGDVADVGRMGGRHRLVDDECARAGPARGRRAVTAAVSVRLHLPELLESLHHVHC